MHTFWQWVDASEQHQHLGGQSDLQAIVLMNLCAHAHLALGATDIISGSAVYGVPLVSQRLHETRCFCTSHAEALHRSTHCFHRQNDRHAAQDDPKDQSVQLVTVTECHELKYLDVFGLDSEA